MLDGYRLNLLKIIIKNAGIMSGAPKPILEIAVYPTANCAASLDFPTTLPSESLMSIPYLSSVCLISIVFKYPAPATPAKDVKELKSSKLAPLSLDDTPLNALLTVSASAIDAETAIK